MRRTGIQQAVFAAVFALWLFTGSGFAFSQEPKQNLPQRPLKIGEILITGNKVLSAQAIIAMSGHKIGDVYTDKTAMEIQQRLAESGNFGMHYPGDPEKWTVIIAEEKPAGSGNYHLRILVDENDPIRNTMIFNSGPIKPEEVEKCIHLGKVYNEADLLKATDAITTLYASKGYQVGFENDCYHDPDFRDVLHVLLIVTRVKEIVIDAPDKEQKRILKGLKTKVGEYFHRQTLKKDLDRLKKQREYRDAFFSEEIVGQGIIRLTFHAKN